MRTQPGGEWQVKKRVPQNKTDVHRGAAAETGAARDRMEFCSRNSYRAFAEMQGTSEYRSDLCKQRTFNKQTVSVLNFGKENQKDKRKNKITLV